MPWHQSFSTNLEEQDAQHQYFVVLLDRLDVACQGDNGAAIEDVLGELERYAKYHFACEELLMAAYEYPAEPHRLEHKKVLSHLAELRAQPDYSRAKIRMFVFKWLINHIQVVDKELAQFVLRRRQAYVSQTNWTPGGVPVTSLLTSTANE